MKIDNYGIRLNTKFQQLTDGSMMVKDLWAIIIIGTKILTWLKVRFGTLSKSEYWINCDPFETRAGDSSRSRPHVYQLDTQDTITITLRGLQAIIHFSQQ